MLFLVRARLARPFGDGDRLGMTVVGHIQEISQRTFGCVFPLLRYSVLMTARQLFIQDAATGRIRFTQAGIARYGARFAQAGFAIRQITTMREFEAAVNAMFALEMENLAAETRGENPALDAIMAGLPGWD